jgi:hypothetical protein
VVRAGRVAPRSPRRMAAMTTAGARSESRRRRRWSPLIAGAAAEPIGAILSHRACSPAGRLVALAAVSCSWSHSCSPRRTLSRDDEQGARAHSPVRRRGDRRCSAIAVCSEPRRARPRNTV